MSRFEVPTLEIIDFAGDLRMAGVTGAHDELAVGMAQLEDPLDRLGAQYKRAKVAHED